MTQFAAPFSPTLNALYWTRAPVVRQFTCFGGVVLKGSESILLLLVSPVSHLPYFEHDWVLRIQLDTRAGRLFRVGGSAKYVRELSIPSMNIYDLHKGSII